MKNISFFGFIAFAAIVMVGCSSSRNAVESRIEKGTSLDGANVVIETTKLQGIDMAESLNEDGTKIVKVAYKWYAGIGKANDKQAAIEMAELEARATISRIIENAVTTNAERGTLINNGDAQKALTTHWQQVSRSIQNACEPYGDTKIEYNQATKMYTVTQKIGMRGDKFQQMLNNAGNFKPAGLSGEALDEFIKVNQDIMKAAKGN